MVVVKKVNKSDIPILVEYMLLTKIPFCRDEEEKLNVINSVNNYLKDNYEKARKIYYNFKLAGAYLINEGSLDLIYIVRKYRYRGIGSKIFKRINKKIIDVKVVKGNEKAIRFFKANGFEISERKEKEIILKRVIDDNDE